jgi:hypothetical protein
MLRLVTPFAGIDAPDTSAAPFRFSVKVPAEPAVLVTTISVTTEVVADGTVYSVVLLVEAAPRNIALEVVAISYYLS